MNSENVVLNIMDLFKYIIRKWKMILLTIVIFAIIACLCWHFSTAKANENPITQNHLDIIRATLSEDKAAEVEYLYAQYVSYVNYRKSIQSFMSDSLYKEEDYEDNIALTKIYFIDSEIDNINQVFIRLSLGTEEYEQIAKAMNRDSSLMDDVYRRVSIGDVRPSSSDQLSVVLDPENDQKKNLLQLYIVAETREQTDSIAKIVEESFEKRVNNLKKIDSEITLTEIDKIYSNNISAFLDVRQNNAVNYLNTINDQISSLQKDYVDKLESSQKDYYNLLKEKDENDMAPLIKPSLLKFLVIGIFLGGLLSVAWITIKYVLDGKIKVDDELSLAVGIGNVDSIKQYSN